MEWTSYAGGMFAKCAHGYYFVYQKFHFESGEDRWFTEYQPAAKNLAEQGQPFAVLLTFKHLDEARRYCEKNAQERAAASKSFS